MKFFALLVRNYEIFFLVPCVCISNASLVFFVHFFLAYVMLVCMLGQTGPPGTCQVGRLVRRPGGPPRQMLK